MAFLGGAVAGAAVALLFTTEKGAEARQALTSTFNKEFDRLSNKIDHLVHPGKKDEPKSNKK